MPRRSRKKGCRTVTFRKDGNGHKLRKPRKVRFCRKSRR